MNEEWRDVVGYEGMYEVSNLGNVRSLDRYINCRNHKKRLIKGQPIKQNLDKKGYYYVGLWRDRKNKGGYIHRLVAQAFIPNPNNYDVVNHKDVNTKNNCVDNLEWCTQQYNILYDNALEKRVLSMESHARKFKCIETDKIYNNQSKCAREYGISQSNLCKVLKSNGRLTFGGHHFVYIGD